MSFEMEEKKIEEYEDRLHELENTYESPSLPSHMKIDVEKNIQTIRTTIDRVQRREDLNFYTVETAELLEKYKEILKTPVKLAFTGKSVQNQTTREKNEIIHEFLNISQKYQKIPVFEKEKKTRMMCDLCGKKEFAVEENAYICLDCFSQQEIIQNTTSYRDVDRVNISSKYSYDRKVHFRDCINQYQGKQNCLIGDDVYQGLEDMFERMHLLIGKRGETPKEERFARITRDHVQMFLKELDFSKHYDNVILIHYTMTGKKPDDISHLEDKLLNDFDILVDIYDKHFKSKLDRVSFISTPYVLYQLLQRHKHKCKKEDFVILKTLDRKLFHDNICKELFELLGWNFTPLY